MSHLVVLVLLAAVPLGDVWEWRRLRRRGDSGSRVPSYVRIILGLWALAALEQIEHPLDRLLAAPEVGVRRLSTAAAVGLTLWMVIVLALPVAAAVVHRATREKLRRASDDVAYLLPRSRAEMVLFAGVSLSAGICEELLYRGFLSYYWLADPFRFPMALSLAASTLLFGLAHAGQGPKGMLGTAVLGLFFGWLYLASGSLLLPMVLHTLVDLRALALARLRMGKAG